MADHDYFREYDLIKARKAPSKVNLAPHQVGAQNKLMNWFNKPDEGYKGGILVLPTGGGKTFTAVRFLCQGPLSAGYKILWLAHTHHLLEQAYYSFGPREMDQQRGYEVGLIQEPRSELNVRVVSGTPDHFRIQQIKPNDDVLICTLQTASSGLKRKQPNFMEFIESAGDKLFVVFDEAHHSPAPSYRNLIINLRERFSKMYLLGLTATPTYSDEKKKGWLKELFPDDIIYQVTMNDLLAQEILAKPVFENPNTEFEPDFDEREFQKWSGSFRDLPENIITQLANSRSRNQFIAKAYANNKDKYGKTLIFADRWDQCVQLCEFLRKEGVKAGAMFTHLYQTGSGRIIGGGDSNAQTLERFRNNELDVLVNIRMLTEGTDVPDVDTVFLTRQTTSQILLTQMIGRALRGPKFGGTEIAHIVSFVDKWKQKINWAFWDPLSGEKETGGDIFHPKSVPWEFISIDLVRHLSQVMFKNQNIEIGPFLKNVPLGWYQTQFYALSEDNENYEETSRLVMVFEDDDKDYIQFMDYLEKIDLSDYENDETTINSKKDELNQWLRDFFHVEDSLVENLKNNLFYIASHMGQLKERPQFFEFEDRKNYDMDLIARRYMDLSKTLSLPEINNLLKEEFSRTDRYWNIIYVNYPQFKQQFDACVNRLLELVDETPEDVYKGKSSKGDDLDDETKRIVKKKYPDCLCCGEEKKMLLEVDHINSKYFGGTNAIDNLQTLCRSCNSTKNTMEIDFRRHESPLPSAPKEIRLIHPPQYHVEEEETWIKYIKRLINLFYCSSAVKTVDLDGDIWKIELYPGNDPAWIKPHQNNILSELKVSRNNLKLKEPEGIIIK